MIFSGSMIPLLILDMPGSLYIYIYIYIMHWAEFLDLVTSKLRQERMASLSQEAKLRVWP
jgi:hypothetical protein